MKDDEQALEKFIQDWHWNKESHKFAKALGEYLFEFIDYLYKQNLSEKTIRKHYSNCSLIGIFECQYGYRENFTPDEVFYSAEASYKYEFKRKVSNSNYAITSYRSTWKKLFIYTKSLAYVNDKST